MPQLTQDQLDQAGALQGSVFDDDWNKLLRLGAGDPMGGLGPAGGMNVGTGIVRGARHPAFRLLQRTAPREAAHLQRSPAIVRFADANAKEMADQGLDAMTIPVTSDLTLQKIRAGGFRGIKIPGAELEEMAQVPGSSVQVYPRGRPIQPQTPLHEAGHALRRARTGGQSGQPVISPTKADAVLNQARVEGLDPYARLKSNYGGDSLHAALDAISRLRTGGFRVR